MTEYPRTLRFDLPEPRRTQVIAAALKLGLPVAVVHPANGTPEFEVEVSTPEEAFAFGAQCFIHSAEPR